MATLPDERALGERPVPQASGAVASYNVPGASNRGSILAGAGSQIAQAGDIIEQTNQKWDAISAEDGYNKLKQQAATLQYDPQSGFAQARGGNAVGQDFTKQYMDQFTDAAAGIADGLKNQQQKLMFQQRVGIAQAQFQSSLLQHQAQQTTVFGNDTNNSAVKNDLNDIAANPYDDNRYETAMMSINSNLAAKFERNGYSSDMAKNEISTIKSAALASRTAGMMLDNPMKAADFFHAHELDFEPSQRLDLARQLKTTVDAQTARADGLSAFMDAKGVVTTSAPAQAPLPANMNADTVRPYDQDAIDGLVKQVKTPFKYDSLIQDAAKKYNISPTELKLRIMAESGGRPDATSDQGAVGLAQLTDDTAKRLGVTNRMDPAQSIDAAGKLMAQYGGTVGGDMSKVDQMYYGPGTPNGPNTKQYVENLRAVRTQLFGAGTLPPGKADIEAMEGPTIANAKAYADAKRPGDMVYQDQVVQEARKNWSQALGVQRAQDYTNLSGLLQVSIGDSGARSLSDLTPQQQIVFSQMPPQNQHSLMNLWESNQRKDDKGDKIVQNEDTDRKTMQLTGEAYSDPVKFKARDLAHDIADLPLNQQTQVMNVWNSMDKNVAKGAGYDHALNSKVITSLLESAKIKIPNAAEKGTPESTGDYDAFKGLLFKAIDNFTDVNKHAPTDKDLLEMAAPLTAQATVVKDGSWRGSHEQKIAARITPNQEATAVIKLKDPTMEKAANDDATSRLFAAYGYSPTPSQIMQFRVLRSLHTLDSPEAAAFSALMRQHAPPSGMIKP